MTIAKRQVSSSNFWRKAGPLLIFASLSLLAACGGVKGPAHFTTTASGQLTVTPATLDFGSVLDGSTGTASGTLTASSASVTVSGVTSSNSLFTVGGLSLPVTIAAGQTVPFTVTFSPQAAGTVSGTLTFTSNGQPSTTVQTLTGTGTTTPPPTGQLGVTPATLALGNVVDGSSGTASGTLTASGGSVTVSAARSSNSVFSVGGLSLPATISAGNSVPFSVTFSPQVPGAASATLSFTSNGQPSTTTEILTGTGTPASTHSVALSWNASTSSNIVGYNLYRAVQSGSCGAFSKINTVLNTGTLYSDSAVTNGTTYCYGATAVDSSNAESSYSNIDSNVQIP
jgi:Abnormal spindle-like microcephaly-assoc'd, ASPM-SPD-2-Hydin